MMVTFLLILILGMLLLFWIAPGLSRTSNDLKSLGAAGREFGKALDGWLEDKYGERYTRLKELALYAMFVGGVVLVIVLLIYG